MENSVNILPLHPAKEPPKPKLNKYKSIQSQLTTLNQRKLIKLRAKKTKDGSYSLYLHLRHNDKQEYHFLKLYIRVKKTTPKQEDETLKLALSIRDKKELELFQNDYDFQLYNHNAKADFLQYFKSVVETKVKADKTIDKSWKHTLKHLTIFTNNRPVSFRQVDEKFCEKFRDYLKQTLSPNTAHVYFAKLKAAFNKAIMDKIVIRNPAQYLHISKQETQREFLTIDELRLLKNTPCKDQQTKNAFMFACFTGLRISDLKKLTWQEIKNGYLYFRQKKTLGVERMKLHKVAIEIIDQQKKNNCNSEKVFKLIADNHSGMQIKKWAKSAKINKLVTWHVARHSFATIALSNGVDIYTVSKLLGHKDIKVTQIYAKIIDEKKDEAIDKLPVI